MGISWDVLMTNTTFPTKNSEVREIVRISKVQLIQKSSKIFFLDIFTWFYRARRAL